MNNHYNYTLSLYCIIFLIFCTSSSLFAQSDFPEYPWLNDIINKADCCNNQKITAYQSGIFTFIYIEKDPDCKTSGNELYFQNGTFYCQDFSDLDCRMAYNLTEDNAQLLWSCTEDVDVDASFTICAGDSVFLPALQVFPTPPDGPDGPDGPSGYPPSRPCQPVLSEIVISPSQESLVDQLNGFTVFPTTTTFYTVTSSGHCGGTDGSFNSDEKSLTYQVIIDNSCMNLDTVNCENIIEKEWIQDFLQEECTGNIYSFEVDGEQVVFISSLCGCVDAADLIYSCDGEEICLFGFVNPDIACDLSILDHLTSENLIWAPECDCECPIDFTPVCGIDGNTYESACEATCAGIEITNYGKCNPTCEAFEALNFGDSYCDNCISEAVTYSFEGKTYLVTFGDNSTCSDAITTVLSCDSSIVLCYDGGIAGFNQCEKFFEKAVKLETKWSKKTDCDGNREAEPCTDLKGLDFGSCNAIMGAGILDGQCVTISGCLDFVIKGVDYSNAFYPTVEICMQTCEKGTDDATKKLFEDFPWLTDIINPDDCKEKTIEVYDLGPYSFVFIETPDSDVLYFEDGTYYCMDFPDYDCRELYGLTKDKITLTWVCGKGVITPGGPVSPTSPVISTPPTSKNNTSDINRNPIFKAFPNPTTGLFKVHINSKSTQKQWVTVYDLYGRIIQQFEMDDSTSGSSLNIDLSESDNGIYFIEWRTENDRKVEKILKQ